MCFTPKISLATALVEFFTVGWIYYRFPKSKLTNFFAVILVFLAIYQLTEFMLCITNNAQLWGKVGFITYTLIPPILIVFSAKEERIKKRYFLYFIPALIFVTVAIADKNFVTYGVCNTLFVTIRNKFFSFDAAPFLTVLYFEYYYAYIGLSVVYLYRKIKLAKSVSEKYIYYLMIITIPLVIIPPMIFIIIFPSFNILFPSVYCHFAMVITLTALISLYYENKIIIKL